jgi:hypothetical protein
MYVKTLRLEAGQLHSLVICWNRMSGLSTIHYLLGTLIRVVIDCEVAHSPAERHEISSHQATISDDRFHRCSFPFGLLQEMLPSTPNSNANGNQAGNPLPSLPDVDRLVTEQRRYEANGAHYTDANVYADMRTFVHGCKGLATED